MPKKILVADLLCGAGGSSTGAQRALSELGLEMELVCVNHWGTAIETHKLNHPEARHYCQAISTVRPSEVVPEGYLDLLMASPTCTHHSVARGGKPTSDQQRSDPWHIITWLTELRVKRMIIENVWEFCGWGPVDPRTGKPIKSRKGEYFAAWIKTIQGLGFEPEWRKLNAADYGDATTRQRFILMARSDKKRVVWPVATHRKREEGKLELFPGLKPWRAAREIIDWNLKGYSIFARPIPLAPKTIERVLAGALKFGWSVGFIIRLLGELERSLTYGIRRGMKLRHAPKAKNRVRVRKATRSYIARLRKLRTDPVIVRPADAEAMIVTLRNNADGRSVEQPIPALAAEGKHVALAQPVIIANRTNNVAKDPTHSPLPCATTATGGGIGLAEPVLMNGRKGNKAASVSTTPVPTLDTKGGVWLAEPLVLSTHNSGAARKASDPLSTITTGGAASEKRQGCARPMLVEPFILGRNGAEGGEASRRARSVNQPMPTSTNRGAGYFVEPFMLSRHAGGAPRSTDQPMPTQVAKHSTALIAPYYGSGSGENCSSGEDPLPTATAKARFGLVVPTTHAGGEKRVFDANESPLPTVTGANRGELAFIAAQFGEREGQAPRVHDVKNPAPTICAHGRVILIEGLDDYDVLFRMLEPHELAAAMGFTSEDYRYEFAGTKTDQIKQIGNAVSVAKMKACVGAIMLDAAPKEAVFPESVRASA